MVAVRGQAVSISAAPQSACVDSVTALVHLELKSRRHFRAFDPILVLTPEAIKARVIDDFGNETIVIEFRDKSIRVGEAAQSKIYKTHRGLKRVLSLPLTVSELSRLLRGCWSDALVQTLNKKQVAWDYIAPKPVTTTPQNTATPPLRPITITHRSARMTVIPW
jgi:hypothetical protein